MTLRMKDLKLGDEVYAPAMRVLDGHIVRELLNHEWQEETDEYVVKYGHKNGKDFIIDNSVDKFRVIENTEDQHQLVRIEKDGSVSSFGYGVDYYGKPEPLPDFEVFWTMKECLADLLRLINREKRYVETLYNLVGEIHDDY